MTTTKDRWAASGQRERMADLRERAVFILRDGGLTVTQTAVVLGISERQVYNLSNGR